MAERRMFAKTIVDSDAFLDLDPMSRLLYYDLAVRADDDGFVNSPKKIMRLVGASKENFAELVKSGFLFTFDSGVVVIRHWKVHNYIRTDTYKETHCLEEKRQLSENDRKVYFMRVDEPSTPCGRSVDEPLTPRGRSVDEPSTQVRVGKDSIDKDSLVKGRGGAREASPATSSTHSSAVPLPPPTEKEFFSSDIADSPQADRGADITADPVDPDSLEALIAEGISEGYINERRHRAEDFARRHKRRLSSVLREWWERDKLDYRETDRSRSGSVESRKPSESSFDTDDFFAAAVAKSIREMEELLRQEGNNG